MLQTLEREAVDVMNGLHRYLAIKEQVDFLNAELEALKQKIIPIVELHENRIEMGDSMLILCERKTYEYSSSTKSIEEEIKKRKKIEELQGIAKVKSVSKFISVRQGASNGN